MKIKLLTIFVLTLSLMSCKNKTQKNNPNTTETEEVTVDESVKLRLDNGEKWVANKETHIGIKNMDSLIKAFNTDDTKNYFNLGEALSKQTSYVIKNCSMKGEPHDQLHIVLVPMLDEISVLKEAKNNKDASKALENLKTLITKYFIHFKYSKT